MNAAAADTGSPVPGILIILVSLGLYWLPAIVAICRRRTVPNMWSVILIDLFLGWTIIGWIVALVYAVRSAPRPVHVTWGPPPMPPAQGPPADLGGYR